MLVGKRLTAIACVFRECLLVFFVYWALLRFTWGWSGGALLLLHVVYGILLILIKLLQLFFHLIPLYINRLLMVLVLLHTIISLQLLPYLLIVNDQIIGFLIQ